MSRKRTDSVRKTVKKKEKKKMFEEGDKVEIIPDSFKAADGTHAKGTVIEEANEKGHIKVEITEGIGVGTTGTFGEGSLKAIEE